MCEVVQDRDRQEGKKVGHEEAEVIKTPSGGIEITRTKRNKNGLEGEKQIESIRVRERRNEQQDYGESWSRRGLIW